MENHQGLVNGIIRWFRLNARQAKLKWPNKPLPPQLQSGFDAGSQTMFNFLHHVVPNRERDPERLDEKGKPSPAPISVDRRQVHHAGRRLSLLPDLRIPL
jgi:hypothetical protein